MSTRHCLAHFIINQTLYNEATATVLVVARRKVEIFPSFHQNIFSSIGSSRAAAAQFTAINQWFQPVNQNVTHLIKTNQWENLVQI